MPPVPPPFDEMVYWILGADGRTPEPVDLLAGLAWVNGNGSVRVAYDEVGTGEVSTVFVPLMADPGATPWLFETRVQGPGDEERFRKWPTYADAEDGHAAETDLLRKAMAGPTLN